MSLLNLQRLVLNVSDPEAAAAWYRQHLGLKDSESTCADGRSVCLITSERVVLIELWTNSVDHSSSQVFRRSFPQRLLIKAENPLHEVFRLLSAGAESLVKVDDGLRLTDPFGLELVICRETAATAA